ncbi:hypothetical protein VKT23_018408 [Stygiomarasmius scandens]|uniref:Uncharacterized protein n=1 Tax=Marasmiellus scandens TaxID=2682957 RepID=A0ABR1IPE2_9AGAR
MALGYWLFVLLYSPLAWSMQLSTSESTVISGQSTTVTWSLDGNETKSVVGILVIFDDDDPQDVANQLVNSGEWWHNIAHSPIGGKPSGSLTLQIPHPGYEKPLFTSTFLTLLSNFYFGGYIPIQRHNQRDGSSNHSISLSEIGRSGSMTAVLPDSSQIPPYPGSETDTLATSSQLIPTGALPSSEASAANEAFPGQAWSSIYTKPLLTFIISVHRTGIQPETSTSLRTSEPPMAAGNSSSKNVAKIVGPVVGLRSQFFRQKHSATYIQPYPLDNKESRSSQSSARTPEIGSNRLNIHKLNVTGPKPPPLNDALPGSFSRDEVPLDPNAAWQARIAPVLAENTHSRRRSSSESGIRSQAASRQIRLREEATEMRQQLSVLQQQANTSENEIRELRAHIQMQAQLTFNWIGGSTDDPPPSYMNQKTGHTARTAFSQIYPILPHIAE